MVVYCGDRIRRGGNHQHERVRTYGHLSVTVVIVGTASLTVAEPEAVIGCQVGLLLDTALEHGRFLSVLAGSHVCIAHTGRECGLVWALTVWCVGRAGSRWASMGGPPQLLRVTLLLAATAVTTLARE